MSRLCVELAIYIDLIPTMHPNSPLFLLQESNENLNTNALAKKFWRMFVFTVIDGTTRHSGRRTFITQSASKGIGVRVLQSLASHRSIATKQLYIDLNDEMKR